MRLVILAAASLFASSAFAAHPHIHPPVDELAPYEHAGQMVEVGQARAINLVCSGKLLPTVILSAGGGGGWSIDWRKVQPLVAKKTRVCAWDRAGSGLSTGSTEPQDLVHTEADLEAAMAAAKIDGPVVMVGQSYGALESMLFTDRHPERVAGVVLVDPSYPDQSVRLAKAAPTLMAYSIAGDRQGLAPVRQCAEALENGAAKPPPVCLSLHAQYPAKVRTALMGSTLDPAYWRAYLSAFDQRDNSAKQAIDPKRDFGSIPEVVLGSSVVRLPGAPAKVTAEIPALQAELQRGQMELATLSKHGVYTRVPDSGHAIMLEKPQVVADAINKVVDQTRAPRPAP